MMCQKIINKQTNKNTKRQESKQKSYHMKATGNVDGSEMLEGHMPSVTTKQKCVKSMLLHLQNKCAGITTCLAGMRIKCIDQPFMSF